MEHSYTQLLPQKVKDRLVLENDEMSWSVEELWPLCDKLSIPIILDFHRKFVLVPLCTFVFSVLWWMRYS